MAKKARRVNTSVKRTPEVCIGYGVVKCDLVLLDPKDPSGKTAHYLNKGDKIPIARAIITAAGFRFRLMDTIAWVSIKFVNPDEACMEYALDHIDPNDQARFHAKSPLQANRFTKGTKDGTLKLSSGKVRGNNPKKRTSRKQELRSTTGLKSSTRTNTMDKKQLKNLISTLKSGEVITMNFVGGKAHLSRDYTVVKTKVGRGKGGSRLLELVDGSGTTITTGTPDSDVILNMIVNGELHGYKTESDIPVAYEKNVGQAANLKETFKGLLDAEGNYTVKVDSTVADFKGTFSVLQATQLRGRGGQVKLSLEHTKTGAKVELWSLRHSGIVKTFEVLTK